MPRARGTRTSLLLRSSLRASKLAGAAIGADPGAERRCTASAACCVSFVSDSERERFGLTRRPIKAALGTSSRSNSSRLPASSVTKKVTPVTLPPGRLKLDTKPSSTGLSPIVKTIGIVLVAAWRLAPQEERWQRSQLPDDELNQSPAPAVGRMPLPPSGIRSPNSGLRRNRFRSSPGGTRP